MKMDVDLEFDKKCRVSLSSNTVLLLNPKSLSIHKGGRDQEMVMEDDRDIRFECRKSVSCRSFPSRLSVVEGSMEHKRGSVYQDSQEVLKMKRIGDGASRKKIEISSTFGLDLEYYNESCRDLPVHSMFLRVAASSAEEEACSSIGFIDIDLDDRCELLWKGIDGDLNDLVEEVDCPVNDGNILLEEDEIQEKLETPYMHSNRQSVDTPKSLGSTKSSRFSPIKKMMDPFLKSKSHKNPSNIESSKQNETLLKPLPCNFLDMKDNFSVAQNMPALLHACLTIKTKCETPLFEFTMKCPEVSFLARIWKRNLEAGDWVYTFHSVNPKRRREFSRRGSNEGRKELPIVGEMHVSSHLCREFSRRGSNEGRKELPIVGEMHVSSHLCPDSNSITDNTLAMEFVLYDLANMDTDKTKSLHGSSCRTRDISQLPKVPEGMLDDMDISQAHDLKQNLDTYPGVLAYPWDPTTLHPNLETAAVIINILLENRESLKFNKMVDVPEVIVVTPAGSHSLPDAEYQGPSSLLDRWRHGGGCECGGWDMGCPLNVFSNPVTQKSEPSSHEANNQQVKQGVQVEMDRTSSISMILIEEGKYDVTFHARLSALQAFSITVAMLHGSEASLIQKDNTSELTAQHNPLKLLIEQELERLTQTSAKEYTKLVRPCKESHMSFTVNPPFSPMSRV